MDPGKEDAFFVAYTPDFKLAFGYVWKRSDFPWMGIWEENRSRSHVSVELSRGDAWEWNLASRRSPKPVET